MPPINTPERSEIGDHLAAPEPLRCALVEPDGTLIARGYCLAADGAEAALLTVVLPSPGRAIQRCLLGSVRDVWLNLRDGRLLAAHLERLAFDPKVGRVCRLRLSDAEADCGAPRPPA
jgi:hypothetical protein